MFKCVKLNILDPLVEKKFVSESKHGKIININIVNSDLYHYLLVSRCNSTFILIKSKKSTEYYGYSIFGKYS